VKDPVLTGKEDAVVEMSGSNEGAQNSVDGATLKTPLLVGSAANDYGGAGYGDDDLERGEDSPGPGPNGGWDECKGGR